MNITPEFIIYLWLFPIVWFFVMPLLFLLGYSINKALSAAEEQASETADLSPQGYASES